MYQLYLSAVSSKNHIYSHFTQTLIEKKGHVVVWTWRKRAGCSQCYLSCPSLGNWHHQLSSLCHQLWKQRNLYRNYQKNQQQLFLLVVGDVMAWMAVTAYMFNGTYQFKLLDWTIMVWDLDLIFHCDWGLDLEFCSIGLLTHPDQRNDDPITISLRCV